MGDPVYTGVAGALRPFVAQLFRLDVRGAEHIPLDGAVIVASNHISHADALIGGLMGLRMRPSRHFRWLGKAELFEKAPLKWVMNGARQIPVERGTSSAADSLRAARASLAEGEAVWVFPEGTISVTFVPMRAHSGVARLALDTGVPVVPLGFWGAQRTLTKFRKRELKRHRPVTIDVGEPMAFRDGEPQQVADEIMEAICGLVDRARLRYPEAPGPDDWWGPPEWPAERAGRWRPKLDKSMSAAEALAEAQRALREGGA